MSRPVVPGCAGCAMAHPDFGRSVNPISTRGGQIMPTQLLLAHPDFQTFRRPWNYIMQRHLWISLFSDIVVAPDCKTRHMRFIYGYVSSQLYRLEKLLKTDLTDYYYPALLVSEGKFGHFHTQKNSPLFGLRTRGQRLIYDPSFCSNWHPIAMSNGKISCKFQHVLKKSRRRSTYILLCLTLFFTLDSVQD